MDNNERNEHFKGFAELLLEDLKECGAIPKFLNAYYAEQARTLIAQRAYDLIYNTRLQTAYGMDLFYIKGWIDENVPDLTEWPKTASQSPVPDK